ncbi:MAG: hypothetical protein DWQ34_00990 [Planctomycetota bacterium]|nr:MAG: hypothetical protein DWQ34_00990 [Planctomycetota bacterium]REK25313.1 MAG: hypothetical protein DWQ41_12265 [Planctomycetota bacterium]REK31808.1 MAG: hypothetical protein DWQ45_18590 [Planctomycetota bacterium]
MEQQSRLRKVSCTDVNSHCDELESQGFQLFSIEKPADAADFFLQVKAKYPLDPEISGKVHWDAFADSLWGGLDARSEPKLALVIQDASEFSHASPRDYEIALSCMSDAAKEVEAEKRKEGHENAMIVLVVGVG